MNKTSISALLHSRQSAGPLCDGSQQVSHSGSGLPDDEAQPLCGGRHRACASAALHPAQPRLPQAAPSPGHHIARGAAEAEEREARAMILQQMSVKCFCFCKYCKHFCISFEKVFG